MASRTTTSSSLELPPAPLLHRSCSPPISTWSLHGEGQPGHSCKPCWRPLGDTWRQWDDEDQSRCKRIPGDGSDFVKSCMPRWSKDARIRTRGLLEHELTWAYYRMRRHESHPQRKAVGEFLDKELLPEKMRFGRNGNFQFWRDLRPPFSVMDFRRVDADEANDLDKAAPNSDLEEAATDGSTLVDFGPHPDGELYRVTYECPIEYVAERLMGDKKDASTFDNKVKGIALVRIPINFPGKGRCLHIQSWGQPTLNPPENWDLATNNTKSKRSERAPPAISATTHAERGLGLWVTKEIEKSGTMRKDMKKKLVKVPPLERIQFGRSASLPRLSKQHTGVITPDVIAGDGIAKAEAVEEPKRARQRRIFTAAAGFVSYAG